MFIVTIAFSNICLRHVYLTAVTITKFHIKLTFSIVSPQFTALTEGLGPKPNTSVRGYKKFFSNVSQLLPFQLHCPHCTKTFDFYIYSY